MKSIADYSRDSSTADGYNGRCKMCLYARMTLSRMNPLRCLKARLRVYGMTMEDLKNLLDSQEHKCAICQHVMRRHYIDHNHTTGAVRALLCCRCNTWLSAIEHPTFVAAASEYLRTHKHSQTPFKMLPYALKARAERIDNRGSTKRNRAHNVLP